MIIILRGTNGAGKSWLMRRVMDRLPESSQILTLTNLKGKLVKGGSRHDNVTILGDYKRACGGCDEYKWKGASNDLEDLIKKELTIGQRVILEGVIVSTWGLPRMQRLNTYCRVVPILLDTSLEECIRSVRNRRLEIGRNPEFNPKNLTGKYETLRASIEKQRKLGIAHEVLSRDDAYRRVLELLEIDNDNDSCVSPE